MKIVAPPFWYMAFWVIVFTPIFWTVGYFAIKWAHIAAKAAGK